MLLSRLLPSPLGLCNGAQDTGNVGCAGLSAYTDYSVRVCAINASGRGLWSNPAKLQTAPAAPSAPQRLSCRGGWPVSRD